MNPELDLLLEREVPVPRDRVWAAWTTPDLLRQWFAPLPYSTVGCEVDLRPGGAFRTVMRSPQGEERDSTSCYLEVVPLERLVWSTALGQGYRPSVGADDLHLTAVISLEDSAVGTRYSALAMHEDPSTRKRHEDMGFHDGWGTALDQLVALVQGG